MRDEHSLDIVGTRDLAGPAPRRRPRTQDQRIARQQTRAGYRALLAPDGTPLGHVVVDRWGNVDSLELRTD